jgi:hypothetical protein
MPARLVLLKLLLLLPVVTGAATPPYKEVMQVNMRERQPVVYARAADHGFGVQYVHQRSSAPIVGGVLGALAGGQIGSLAGETAVAALVYSGATTLSQADAETLAPLFDRAVAQQDLENALSVTLASLPLFSSTPVVKAIAPGERTNATAFSEDPVLVVELFASLTVDYRGLQVTALAYELSGAELTADPRSTKAGRVYRNRFDYVSSLLPIPPIKTKEEIKADVAAVKAKYQGRKLTNQEQVQRKEEVKDAARGTTLEKWRAPLLEHWQASGGANLHEALQLGTSAVVELLGKDLLEFKPVEVRPKEDMIGWRTFLEAGVDRYTSIFVGGPFTGALLSEPSGLTREYCQGTAFSKTLAKHPLPKMCPGE